MWPFTEWMNEWMNEWTNYNCIETFDICNFDRYFYNNYDYFHILGILPVYGYIENRVLNEWMNEWMTQTLVICKTY